MEEKDYQKLKDIIKERTEKEFAKQYRLGLMAGFNAALIDLYEQIKDMPTVEEVRAHIKDKQEIARKNLMLKFNDNE